MRTCIVLRWVVCIGALPGFIPISGQDTVLTKFIPVQDPIVSMTHDGNGKIWLNTRLGLYSFDGDQLKWERKLKERRVLEYNDGQLDFLEELYLNGKPNKTTIAWKKNQSWSKFLPHCGKYIFSAPDRKGIIWVTSGQHLFGFNVKPLFFRTLHGHSLRGILEYDGNVYIGSYSGMFLNGILCLGDTIYTNGNLQALSSRDILLPSRELLRYNRKSGTLYKIPFSKKPKPGFHSVDYILKTTQTVWAGSNVGLLRLSGDTLVEENLRLPVEYLYMNAGILYIATKEGIYRSTPNHQYERIEQFPILEFNFLEKIGDTWWAASEKGIWRWQGGNESAERLFPNDLPGNIEVCAILRDRAGYFWASSISGLFRFQEDGVQYESFLDYFEFNKRSFAVIQDTFYFGGVNGLVTFDPLAFPPVPPTQVSATIKPTPAYSIGLAILLLLGIAAATLYILWRKTERTIQIIQLKNKKDRHQSFLEKLENHILSHIGTVTVQSLSDFSGLSERTFYRVLKDNYDLTPGDLIRNVKNRRIKELTTQYPSLPKDELARLTGYSVASLSRILNES